jgi:hypothetical protein
MVVVTLQAGADRKQMTRPWYREVAWIVLLCAAFAAAVASVWVGDRIDCDENGAPALAVLGLGAIAVVAATWSMGVRLRWGLVWAVLYALGVYVYLAAQALGNCTA